MRNVHLRINYGADDRYDVVTKTLVCSREYFKTMRVVNLGPDENMDKFVPLLPKFPNLSLSNYGRYYHMCETEDLLRSHGADVPDGDWMIWLDSDWRLPEYFLDNMQKEIEICEAEGINHLFSYQIQHHIVPNPKLNIYREYDQKMLDYRFNAFRHHPESYGWPLIMKVNKKNAFCGSFLGNHPHLLYFPYNKRAVPEMYHLHFRDYDDKAYCGSSTFLCWWYLGHHVFKVEEQLEIQRSREFKMLEEFKDKHKCYTSTQLHERIKNKDTAFLSELKEIFMTFDKTEIFSCKQMYRLASEFNMEFYQAPPETRCEGICCKYKGKNIIDLTNEYLA